MKTHISNTSLSSFTTHPSNNNELIMGSLEKSSVLPTIDFTKIDLKPGSSSWISVSKGVVHALESYGCFIVIYNGVSSQLHEEIFGATKELFELPTEIKVLNTSDTPCHGYVGQVPVIPLYEGLGIENATTLEGVTSFTNLLWPFGNDHFRETVLEYSRIVAGLDQVVMRMVAESYGIENRYESLLGSTSYLLKLIKYQGVPENNGTKLGIVPHTDKSLMSILHQHQVKGLEIKTKNDEWILVDPSPSSFIVMAGEACTAWTNGRIEAALHRVIMRGSEERYSLGLFSFIRDFIIEAAEELVDDEHPLQFKPFDHYKFLHFHASEDGRRSKCAIKAYCGVEDFLI